MTKAEALTYAIGEIENTKDCKTAAMLLRRRAMQLEREQCEAIPDYPVALAVVGLFALMVIHQIVKF